MSARNVFVSHRILNQWTIRFTKLLYPKWNNRFKNESSKIWWKACFLNFRFTKKIVHFYLLN